MTLCHFDTSVVALVSLKSSIANARWWRSQQNVVKDERSSVCLLLMACYTLMKFWVTEGSGEDLEGLEDKYIIN